MKNSNIMIISAIAIILISLTVYNFTLRASYRNGDYKNPFYGLNYNPVNSVSQIELNSSNKIACYIRQGKKSGIYLSDRAKDKVIWSVGQDGLKIDLTDEAKRADFVVYDDDLVIVLNNLVRISTKPYFRTGEKWEQGRLFGHIGISGFREDSMDIDLGASSSAVLDSISVGRLNASIGEQGKGVSSLQLHAGIFDKAVFKIPGAGKLELLDPQITKSEYHLSNAATVSLNGKSLQIIKENGGKL
ncbi:MULTISPECIES: hypothetical protein [unclassified Pedobacter]|uniref:hypothetical protein n=1 Tax=unclassified Pedobacter TaxID=2628915 RepID=UPI001D85ADA1|nr:MULTISPECIES: hypothetical protein [unclassified Pedobacter]CAH0264608.1 hypothetical protein SRABI36_03562 [Pedobacter sp. Bi36]CAH0291130.1 hypothetical protein SRABI126_04056 [Pedobacter sp. Bi126]